MISYTVLYLIRIHLAIIYKKCTQMYCNTCVEFIFICFNHHHPPLIVHGQLLPRELLQHLPELF